MDELINRLLEKINKIKEGIDENVLSFILSSAVNELLNYCHIDVEDWDERMDHTTILMAIDLYNDSMAALKPDEVGQTKSLSEGEFSIQKETTLDVIERMQATRSFVRHYARTLNHFRKMAR